MMDKNETYTPVRYIKLVKKVLGLIALDPFSCGFANEFFINAKKYMDKEFSAYDFQWEEAERSTVFMNPPYSDYQYEPAIERFLQQLQKWKFSAITLTNNNTDTFATQKLMRNANAICFPDHRINFFGEDGKIKKGNRYAQMFCYFGSKKKRFRSVFSEIGTVYFNSNRR